MYKLLLTWRYLLTRYIALICVISVTLGVATMIVVNAVMLGFSREMENRMHGALSDVTIGAWSSLRGIENIDEKISDVWKAAGDMVEAVTPTISTQALLNYEIAPGEVINKPVELIGIDCATQEKVTAISQYLQHRENRNHLSFTLLEDGYDVQNHLAGDRGVMRPTMTGAGWKHRRNDAVYEKYRKQEEARQKDIAANLQKPQSDFDPIVAGVPETAGEQAEPTLKKGVDPKSINDVDNPYAAALAGLVSAPDYSSSELDEDDEPEPMPRGEEQESGPHIADSSPLDSYDDFAPQFDKATQQNTGVIIGIGVVSGNRYKTVNPETKQTRYCEPLFVVPGDDVTLSCLSLGNGNTLPSIVSDRFTVTDIYESRMVLYDQSFVFVPIEKLQDMRNMIGADGKRMATNILIKAKPGVDINKLRDKLQAAPEFPSHQFMIRTWRDSQANMLEAVSIELGVLNVLLFLIIAVAGFGILAIFFMIVIEKTRDIGILKSLGVSGFGVMQIFLYYGLALGLLGSGLGLALGVLFVKNINLIASWLSKLMGHDVFNPEVYNFYEVPAIIEPWTVIWIVFGSVLIAVISGVIPALRAARLKPVDALRI